MTLRCAKRKIVLDLGMSTLKEESAHWAGLAGAKNNTRGVLDRPGTQLLRLRPTVSPQLLRGLGGVDQRSAVEADRLLVAAVPMAPCRLSSRPTTPYEYASHSPAIVAPQLARITVHST